MKIITVRGMNPGQTAQISSVSATGVMGRIIREMGIIPPAEITVSGRVPLKDPVAAKVGGAVTTLRNKEADQIVVIKEPV